MSRRQARWLVAIAALAGLLAVAAGAAGSHTLQASADPRELRWFRTATDYQMNHALALFGVALWAHWRPGSRVLLVAAAALLAGLVLFCGSLYAMALGADPALARLTPFGGVSFLIGWGALAWSAVFGDAAD